MKKTLTLVLLAALSYALKAQTPPADLVAWTGQGSNYSIFEIDFNDSTKASSAVMWGYRYDSDSITAQEMIEAIVTADPKLTGEFSPFATDIYYKDLKGETPEGYAYYWGSYTKDENSSWFLNSGGSSKLGNGQYFAFSFVQFMKEKISDSPVSADILPAERALLSTTDISQWLGKGKNEAVLVLDFGVEEASSTYAWGVRFDADSITGQELLDIAIAADTNLSGSVNNFITDVYYKTLVGETPIDYAEFWMTYTSNGDYVWGANMGNNSKLGNGQWFGAEFTDDYLTAKGPSEAITALVPFSEGTTVIIEDNIPLVVGIPYDSSAFVAWATGVVIKRGFLNAQDTTITDKGTNKASFGSEENALGSTGKNSAAVVSLGDAGEAVLTFKYPIMNGEGADFAVFENGFDVTFLELAFVEVSSDGENFFRFPTQTKIQDTVQVGSFSPIDPTKIYGFAGMHKVGVGTPFDLEVLVGTPGLDVNAVTHVKIIDVIGAISGNPVSLDSDGNVVNDPYPTAFASGGFDLDGVGVIHQNIEVGISNINAISFSAYPNPVSGTQLYFTQQLNAVQVFDALGNEVMNQKEATELNVASLQAGMYVVKSTEGVVKFVVK